MLSNKCSSILCVRTHFQPLLTSQSAQKCWRWVWTISSCPPFERLISEIETCQLFLGQAAAVTRSLIVLTSVSSLIHMEQGGDDAAGQNWHRPQRAASHACTFDLLYCVCPSAFMSVCVCVYLNGYVCLWSARLRRSILRLAGSLLLC